MNIRHHLRHIDHSQMALELLRNNHAGSKITNLKAGERYLQLLLNNKYDLQCEALLNVDIWLQEMDYLLPGIPWRQVPLSYLLRWLNSLQLSFILKDEVWNVERVELPTSPLPEKVLSLPTQPCPLLCLHWPEIADLAGHKWRFRQYGIPFILHIVLGHSLLAISLTIDIAVGDMLIIQHNHPFLKIGNNKLFHLSLSHDQEVIVQEKFICTEENYRDEEESLLKWSDLPVEIEFVLDSKVVTLAELDTIQPGTSFSLNQDAEQRVKIFLNKKYFGHGELVALENGYLAVEVNQVNTISMGELETSDAE